MLGYQFHSSAGIQERPRKFGISSAHSWEPAGPPRCGRSLRRDCGNGKD